MSDWSVHEDVRRARTLSPEFYRDAGAHERLTELAFARSWQLLPPEVDVAPESSADNVVPFTLLPGCLDEPLVLTRDDDGERRCLSNACTHRANVVARERCARKRLRCDYHGRTFALDGRCLSSPEFEGLEGFPCADDDLPALDVESLGPFRFTTLGAAHSFDDLVGPVRERLEWLPWDELRFDADTSRDYDVRAHWALYLDNYLEGLHVPFVHPQLAPALDWSAYRVELFELSSVQVGVAAADEVALEPPSGPDAGQRVGGYYWWLFPNTMLNVYPWGISVNLVEPRGLDRMRVRFFSWVWAPEHRDSGAGAGLDEVELQDEDVVQSVQLGVRSRLFRGGRFCPQHEDTVHHFHRLLSGLLRQD